MINGVLTRIRHSQISIKMYSIPTYIIKLTKIL